ncbi:hypothetical protein Syun_017246 [Stephania yunnanensis]|uniref:Uncharacterized protein n=1 Tax=Stephania yunnanensis TaxID=152371 RepID=A0AAP0J6Q3_9MAGN
MDEIDLSQSTNHHHRHHHRHLMTSNKPPQIDPAVDPPQQGDNVGRETLTRVTSSHHVIHAPLLLVIHHSTLPMSSLRRLAGHPREPVSIRVLLAVLCACHQTSPLARRCWSRVDLQDTNCVLRCESGVKYCGLTHQFVNTCLWRFRRIVHKVQSLPQALQI